MDRDKVAWIFLSISLIVFTALIIINFVIYVGVVSLWVYFPILVFIQVLFYRIRKYTSVLLLLNTTIILTFVVVYVTIHPTYDYEDGKTLLEQRAEEELNFIDIEHKTVPTTDKNQLLYRNLNYYYKVSYSSHDQFYTVDPITGKIFILNAPFYD